MVWQTKSVFLKAFRSAYPFLFFPYYVFSVMTHCYPVLNSYFIFKYLLNARCICSHNDNISFVICSCQKARKMLSPISKDLASSSFLYYHPVHQQTVYLVQLFRNRCTSTWKTPEFSWRSEFSPQSEDLLLPAYKEYQALSTYILQVYDKEVPLPSSPYPAYR